MRGPRQAWGELSARTRGIAADVFPALFAGVLIGVTNAPWTQGVWVGALFLAVSMSRRLIAHLWTQSKRKPIGASVAVANES